VSEFDQILADIDLETTTAERREIWVGRLKQALEREIIAERRAKPRKCSRPSCTRLRRALWTHCCRGCQLDMGHAPTCQETQRPAGEQ
jgi:hypothetical protein